MPAHDLPLRSLAFATDIDVLPEETEVDDLGPRVVVRSPTNPTHYWGNFLLEREPAAMGSLPRLEALFVEHVAARNPGTAHRAFGWDCVDGDLGPVEAELAAAGYEVERVACLVAEPGELVLHDRANRDVVVRALDPAAGADDVAWAQVHELQVVNRPDGHVPAHHSRYAEQRMADRRRRFQAGDGAWVVAELEGVVVAGCGVIVTRGRCRYQDVDTAELHRRRGVASRLVHDAGRLAIERFGAERLVIGAEADHHAATLYQSLGFVPRELGVGAAWWPTAPRAGDHPELGHLAHAVS